MIYKIADVLFDIEPWCENSKNDMKEFVSQEKAFAEKISVEKSQIEFIAKEQRVSCDIAESMCLARSVSEFVFENANGCIFHSSAISVGGHGILFAAPSGTGKSTHARLWRENFSDVEMVNDDKPLIREVDGEFRVYGSPWRGKHRLGMTSYAKIEAICFIERANENSAERMSISEAMPKLLNQTLRPRDEKGMEKLLDFMEKLAFSVKIFKLKVNMSKDAAIVSRKAILEDL